MNVGALLTRLGGVVAVSAELRIDTATVKAWSRRGRIPAGWLELLRERHPQAFERQKRKEKTP